MKKGDLKRGAKTLKREVLNDIRIGVVLSTLIVPFPMLGIFNAPWWAWAIYIGWFAFVVGVNIRPPKKRKFKHFELE